jgi:hypothetical protein
MPSKEASQRNGRKSTGPRTPAGKQKIRLNALWHGAFAKEPLLPGEDSAVFLEVQRDFQRLHKPASPDEEFLVNRMVLAAWRLHRLAAMEPRVLCAHDEANGGAAAFQRLAWAYTKQGLTSPTLPSRPEPEPEPQTKSERTASPTDWIARAWLLDTAKNDAIMKLMRYQNSLERSFYRALHELRSLRESKL